MSTDGSKPTQQKWGLSRADAVLFQLLLAHTSYSWTASSGISRQKSPNGKNGTSELQTLQKTVISDGYRGGFVVVVVVVVVLLLLPLSILIRSFSLEIKVWWHNKSTNKSSIGWTTSSQTSKNDCFKRKYYKTVFKLEWKFKFRGFLVFFNELLNHQTWPIQTGKQENHPQHSCGFQSPSHPPIPEWAEEGIFQAPCITISKESERKKNKKHSKRT